MECIKKTTCGIDYIKECIRVSTTNYHYAYLTLENKIELERQGYRITQKDYHTMSKIEWPKI